MSYGGYGIREERRERKVSMQPAKNDSKSRGRLLAGLGLLGPGETFGARPDLADGGNTSDSVNTGEGSAVVSARSAVLEVGGGVDALESGRSGDGASLGGSRAKVALSVATLTSAAGRNSGKLAGEGRGVAGKGLSGCGLGTVVVDI